jgi:hypothetical protein
MAALTSVTVIGNVCGHPANPGAIGCEIVRLVLDGGGAITAGSVAPTYKTIKTITSVIGCGKLSLTASQTFPVAATTGFTVDAIAANNATASQIVDLLVFGTT